MLTFGFLMIFYEPPFIGESGAIHMNEGSLSLHRKRLGVQCQGEVEGPPDVPSTKELKEAAGVCADAVSYGT